MEKMISRGVVLFLAAALATPAVSIDMSYRYDDDVRGITSHPLVPHREQLIRRERERRLKNPEGNAEIWKEDVPRPHRYSRHLDGQARTIGALYQGYGTHYVDVWVGTPTAQRQTVIVDTGSGVTAFPCSKCDDCGESYHTDGYFMESESDTFETVDCDSCMRGHCSSWNNQKVCRISMSYQEGSSWAAYEARDWAYVGGPHDEPLETGISITQSEKEENLGDDPFHASAFAFRLDFGCQTSLTGLFKTQLADGIMGMDNGETSFWKQMKSSGSIDSNNFSLCFAKQTIALRDGTMAGTLTMGGVDTRLHETPMVYASNTRTTGFYAVKLRKIYLREGGGESAKSEDLTKVRPIDIDDDSLNYGGVIVDSGTTDTYFTSKLAAPFKQAWKEIVGTDYTHSKVALTNEQLLALPTILFQLEADSASSVADPSSVTGLSADVDPSNPTDVLIALPATHYMEYNEQEGKYTARFYIEESSGSVLGANTMMGHDVHFDIDGHRIGFAESQCDFFKLSGLDPTGYGGLNDMDSDDGQCSWWCIFLIIIGLIGAAICGCLCWKRFGDQRDKVPASEEDADDNLDYPEEEDSRFVHDEDMGEAYDGDTHDGRTQSTEGIGYSDDPNPPRMS